ncbi:hypothetical protein [Brevibacillus brevis]|uniref:GntR family transcriptional regulator n=1 Tax=Brevibacillus brevis TaxID=1393 RepID=A0ABY9T1Y1_BREBE|nr:hypothetical protein [Brevibacillus brevis]WNC13499.1 hypothetical protein RGB73_22790 [Brevibacillus brevis]
MSHSVGLHILLQIDTNRSEDRLIAQALDAGIRVYPSGRSWFRPPGGQSPRIIVGFGGMKEEDIEEGIRLLAEAWFGKRSSPRRFLVKEERRIDFYCT